MKKSTTIFSILFFISLCRPLLSDNTKIFGETCKKTYLDLDTKDPLSNNASFNELYLQNKWDLTPLIIAFVTSNDGTYIYFNMYEAINFHEQLFGGLFYISLSNIYRPITQFQEPITHHSINSVTYYLIYPNGKNELIYLCNYDDLLHKTDLGKLLFNIINANIYGNQTAFLQAAISLINIKFKALTLSTQSKSALYPVINNYLLLAATQGENITLRQEALSHLVEFQKKILQNRNYKNNYLNYIKNLIESSDATISITGWILLFTYHAQNKDTDNALQSYRQFFLTFPNKNQVITYLNSLIDIFIKWGATNDVFYQHIISLLDSVKKNSDLSILEESQYKNM